METKPTTNIEAHLDKLRGPRIGNAKHQKSLDILVAPICAVISGADSWE